MVRACWWVAALAGCSSNWGAVDLVVETEPDAPSVLATCAAGGAVAEGDVAGILCTSPTDLLTGPLDDGTVALLPGPIDRLAP